MGLVEIGADLGEQWCNGAAERDGKVRGWENAVERLESLARDGVEDGAVGALLELSRGGAECVVGEEVAVAFGSTHAVAGLIHRHRNADESEFSDGAACADDGRSFGQDLSSAIGDSQFGDALLSMNHPHVGFRWSVLHRIPRDVAVPIIRL